MKQYICRECGHVFSLYGRSVQVRTGYVDDSVNDIIETWRETHIEHLCQGCSEMFPYAAEWDGIYYKEVQISKKGVPYERS